MRALLVVVTLAAGCGAGEIQGETSPDAGPSAVDAGGTKLGSFQLTYYWVTDESDFTGAADTDLYDPTCAVLATVPSAFASSITLEGTGRLADGTVLNYAGACSCPLSPCFEPVDAAHPWGSGAGGRALVPFKSIAVDPSMIPIGTRVWLQELDGVMMPDGSVHDGCVSADDTGGGIVGQHIDFFAALESSYRTLDGQLGLDHITVWTGRCP